ncbi:glycosyltransferase family 39 protein [Parvibaculum sp.]|uniref:ArnT family glycosyltransferase n=1 Tax=Parvibaculum sp. TaxID=2024848 RepID=UPI00321003AF
MKLEDILKGHRAVPLFFAALLALFFLFDIGGRSVSSPDEGRYIEIPREMVETGDYVLPRLDGVLYFEKPPLFYWLEAGAIKALGITEGTMRLWPAILGFLGCLMTYGIGRRFYGRTAGLVSAAILATTLLYYALARFIILDMLESVTMAASLFSFLLSAEEKDEKRAIWWARAGHVAAALAVLSKGLIGVVLPGAVGLVWIALSGRWSFVRRALCPSGILLFLLVAAPWHVLAAMRNHDFLWFYFVHEHLMRFTTDVHRRDGPIYYFVAILAVGFLPWTGYLWNAVKEALPSSWKARNEKPVELFLLVWAVVIFVFFSVSSSKLPPYILPIFPPLALLVGRVVAPRIEAGLPDTLPVGRYVFAGVFGLLGLAVPIAYTIPALRANADVGPYLDLVKPFVFTMSVLFIGASLATLFLSRRFGMRATFLSVIVGGALGWIGVSLVASKADPNSIKPVAETINLYRQHGERVASFGTLFYDLPVYIKDKVIVVNNKAEFDFGMTQEDVSQYVMQMDQFSKLWNGHDLMFMVMRANLFETWKANGMPLHMCVIKRTERAIGLSNYPLFNDKGQMICDPWYDLEDKHGVQPKDGDSQTRHTAD